RLTDKQIAERRQTATSLMPTGLLDKLSDRDIADLYAYLRSLGDGPKKRRRRFPSRSTPGRRARRGGRIQRAARGPTPRDGAAGSGLVAGGYVADLWHH